MPISTLVLCALVLPAPRVDEPIVVEIESPILREPNDNSFARPHAERWASGRKCAIRFYGKGTCTYALEVPEAGRWFLWLRYASAAGVDLEAEFVDEEGGGELDRHELPGTGALEGKHAWGWAPLFAGELAGGEHRYAIRAASFRPDCLLLTTEPGEPTYLAPRPMPSYDAETLELIAKPIVDVRPEWLDEAKGYELPEWFDETRVCMHTRLSPRWLLEDEFRTAAASFRSLGVRCFVRHLKTHGEAAWWPSAVGPKEMWASRVDVARGIIERAHDEGCRIIAYYRHMEDGGMAERHPEWVARDDLGEPYQRRQGEPMLCFNSPAAEYVEKRLLELVDRGADGFYFDEVHMPPTGCWCEYCREGFREATGLEHPESIDEEDPLFRKLQDFTNLSIERTFLRWRRALHERRSDVVLLVGSYRSPDFSDRHQTNRLLRLADSVKTEFDKGASSRTETFCKNHPELRLPPRDVRLALGWMYCRDAADGRPPHVWIPRITDEASAVFATAAVIAHGGIANLDHPEESLPDPETFGKAIELGNRLSEYLGGARPFRWAAIHLPERAKDRVAPDEEALWREVIAPVTGTFEVMLRERRPVGIVTDSQLEEGALDRYRMLYLPAPGDLTLAMRESVRRFREKGGCVVEQRGEWAWHDPDRFERTAREFLEAADVDLKKGWHTVVGGPETLHVLQWWDEERRRLILVLVNDFSWVHTAGGRSGAAPPPCEGVRIRFGAPTPPPRVTEIVTGVELDSRKVEHRVQEVVVPAFPTVAVIVVRGR